MRTPPPTDTQAPRTALRPGLLTAVLLLAFAVRLAAALREPALGQSDAYGHLQFINDTLVDNALRHPTYPSLYHRLLAAATSLLGVDAYHTARYAGAFFGTALTAALFGLARAAFGRPAALWAAFLVAAFPAFHWLQKTGVGAYPNQLGLLLAPLALLAWDRFLTRGIAWFPLFCAAVGLWLASVPIMFLDVTPLLALDFAVRALRREVRRPIWITVVTAVLAASTAVAWFASRGGTQSLLETIGTVAGLPLNGLPSGPLGWWQLAASYALPKRWTVGGPLVQTAVWGAGVVLVVAATAAWRRSTTARLVALWALVAWAQTAFGCCQFALYLRAGWMLLAAIAILGGWLIHETLRRLWTRPRHCMAGALAASACVSFLVPPTPAPHLSPAESDLVVLARQTAATADPTQPLTVWSREYTGFYGNQGDPLHALLERHPGITVISVNVAYAQTLPFDPTTSHLIILDDRAEWRHGVGLMRWASPGMTQDFVRNRETSMAAARALRLRAAELVATGAWRLQRGRGQQGLEWLRLEPLALAR